MEQNEIPVQISAYLSVAIKYRVWQVVLDKEAVCKQICVVWLVWLQFIPIYLVFCICLGSFCTGLIDSLRLFNSQE
jgi:hypothetical protein